MKDNPLVSIIIPVYNTPKKYLTPCLESVKRQDYKNTEVIIVDDGSDKNTVEFLNSFIKGSHVQAWQVIHRKNGGLSAARNTGYEVAIGKYIQFLDSDDYFGAKLISSAVSIAEETEAEIVIENFELYDTRSGNQTPALSSRDFPSNNPFKLLDLPASKIGTIPYSSWSKLFRKDFLDANKIRHDEGLHRAEDILFSYAALVRAKKIALLPKSYITYLENIASSNSGTNDGFPADSVKAWQKLYDLLHELDLYKIYKNDFESAMLWSVAWHLERLHNEEGIKQLGTAAQIFINEIQHKAQDDQTLAIALASVSPDAFRLLKRKDEERTALYARIDDLEKKLDNAGTELEILRRPGVKHASRKLAGAVRRRLRRSADSASKEEEL